MRQNKTILFVSNDIDYFYRHFLPIALECNKNNWLSILVIPDKNSSSDFVKTINKNNINIFYYRFNANTYNIVNNFITIIDLYYLYKKIKPDLVHHFTIRLTLLGGIAARLVHIPAIVNTISGLGYLFDRSSPKNIFRLLVIWGFKFAFSRKNQIGIFFNTDDRDYFIEHKFIDYRNTCMINGTGVDLQVYQPSSLPQGMPIVLLPARFVFAKGVVEFVEAAQIVNRQNKQARFVLVGKIVKNHPEAISGNLLKQWKKESTIEYWGYQKNMKNIYVKSSIVCLPSHYEGLPTTLLEAAACARPIIASDIAGCRRVVKHQINGLLVPAKVTLALAEAIKYLLHNPKLCLKMGKEGRRIAEQKFDIYKIAQYNFALYRKLL